MAPPWGVADMLAVMKKDMAGTLHANGDLARCHSRLAAALKAGPRPPSLPLLADLASNVSSVLLMLPLPAKTDKGEAEEGEAEFTSFGQPTRLFTCANYGSYFSHVYEVLASLPCPWHVIISLCHYL